MITGLLSVKSITISALAFFCIALLLQNLSGIYIAIVGHVLIYMVHILDQKLDLLLDYHDSYARGEQNYQSQGYQ
jgi:hypothetical protein